MSISLATASLLASTAAPSTLPLSNSVVLPFSLDPSDKVTVQATTADGSVVTIARSGEQSDGSTAEQRIKRSQEQVPISNPPNFYESWLKYYLETFPGQRRRLEDLLGKEDKVFVEEFERILQEVKDKLDESGSDVAKSIRGWYIRGLIGIIQGVKDRESNGPPNDPQQSALSAFKVWADETNNQVTKELSPPEDEPSSAGETPDNRPLGAAVLFVAGLFVAGLGAEDRFHV